MRVPAKNSRPLTPLCPPARHGTSAAIDQIERSIPAGRRFQAHVHGTVSACLRSWKGVSGAIAELRECTEGLRSITVIGNMLVVTASIDGRRHEAAASLIRRADAVVPALPRPEQLGLDVGRRPPSASRPLLSLAREAPAAKSTG